VPIVRWFACGALTTLMGALFTICHVFSWDGSCGASRAVGVQSENMLSRVSNRVHEASPSIDRLFLVATGQGRLILVDERAFTASSWELFMLTVLVWFLL